MIARYHLFAAENLICAEFARPKPDEHESGDRFTIVPKRGEAMGVQLALADGCSASLYGPDWAQTLVEACTVFADQRSPQVPDLLEQLPRIRQMHKPIAVTRRERIRLQQEGDFSTLLLASVFWERGRLRVSALAIGDTCVAMFEPGKSSRTFPISSSRMFRAPSLIWSHSGLEATARLEDFGPFGTDCLVVACTDEVARWLMHAIEASNLGEFWEMLKKVVVGQRTLADLRLASGFELPSTDDITMLLLASARRNGVPNASGDPKIQLSVQEGVVERESDHDLFESEIDACAACRNMVVDRMCQVIDGLLESDSKPRSGRGYKPSFSNLGSRRGAA